MLEKLGMMGKLASCQLLALYSDQQQSANYRGNDIDHRVFERSHLIRKGGDVIHQ